jgi:TolB-like protein/Flp pilus assembly protein TadD
VSKLEKIDIDLGTYKVLLHFQNNKEPILLHFDTPSRRFYFALIALIVTEMKNLDKPGFIHIRNKENTLKLLDNSLSGQNASKTVDGMWDKIRKAWRYKLPDLETAAYFKILKRDLVSPYEKGGKYRYDCSDDECDIWANLFDYDENNPWRFKFAIDSASLSLNDISVTLGDLRDNSAWQEFVKSLRIQPQAVSRDKRAVPRWRKKAAFSLAAVSIVVAVTWAIWNSYIRPVPPMTETEMSDKLSIAVLPFVNMSGDPEQEYFSDGITDDLITDLSKIHGLFVIARNSTFTYKGKSVKAPQIAKELGVRYILEGSVRKEGAQVRINAQLIDATTGHHLWAERYDGNLGDIFDLQDRFTQKIASALAVKLTADDEFLLAHKGTDNIEAYDAYLQGLRHQHRDTRDDIVKAVSSFKRAIELDPEYPEAHAALSLAYQHIVGRAWEKDLELKGARSLAQKHLQIAMKNPTPLAHRMNSRALLYYEHRHEKSIAEAERALALDPNDASSYWYLARALSFSGRHAEAIKLYEKAMRLNPYYPGWYPYFLGVAQYCLERYEDAASSQERAFRVNPNSSAWWLAAAYAQLGREEEAADVLTKYIKKRKWKYGTPVETTFEYWPFKDPIDLDRFADGLLKAGLPRPWNPVYRRHYAEALAEAERALSMNPDNAEAQLTMGETLILVGRSSEAVSFIKKAMELNPNYPPFYLHLLALAHFCLEEYDQALVSLKTHNQSDTKESKWLLAATYGYIGRKQEASEVLQNYMKKLKFTGFTVKSALKYANYAFKDPKDTERFAEGLRKAGLK